MFGQCNQLRNDIVAFLQDFAAFAIRLGDKEAALAQESAIRELKHLRFNIAILGSVNSGKSTLVNTLLRQSNDELSPVDFVVCTGTMVHYMDVCMLPEGEQKPVIKVYKDGAGRPDIIGRQELATYIKEDSQAEQNLSYIEVYDHFPQLGRSCLVDTPGSNAVVEGHGKLVRDFLPHADIVVMLLNGQDDMKDGDYKLMKLLSAYEGQKLFFVITKRDRMDDREVQGMLKGVKSQIKAYGIQAPEAIVEVSAKKVFSALCKQLPQDEINTLAHAHGISRLESSLSVFMTEEMMGKALYARFHRLLVSCEAMLEDKKQQNESYIKRWELRRQDLLQRLEVEKEKNEKYQQRADSVLGDYQQKIISFESHIKNAFIEKKEAWAVEINKYAETGNSNMGKFVTQMISVFLADQKHEYQRHNKWLFSQLEDLDLIAGYRGDSIEVDKAFASNDIATLLSKMEDCRVFVKKRLDNLVGLVTSVASKIPIKDPAVVVGLQVVNHAVKEESANLDQSVAPRGHAILAEKLAEKEKAILSAIRRYSDAVLQASYSAYEKKKLAQKKDIDNLNHQLQQMNPTDTERAFMHIEEISRYQTRISSLLSELDFSKQ